MEYITNYQNKSISSVRALQSQESVLQVIVCPACFTEGGYNRDGTYFSYIVPQNIEYKTNCTTLEQYFRLESRRGVLIEKYRDYNSRLKAGASGCYTCFGVTGSILEYIYLFIDYPNVKSTLAPWLKGVSGRTPE